MKFYPYEKGGGGSENVLAMLKGGGAGAQKVLGYFLRGRLKFSHIVGGGTRKFSLFKRWGTKGFTLS